MSRGRRWIAVVILVAFVAAIAGWVVAVRTRPSARNLLELLPSDADAYVLVDFPALQSNPVVKSLLADPSNVAPASDYEQLLNRTGFHYQEDLKQLALAKLGEDWVGAAEVNADRARVISYLESQGAVKTEARGQTIYSFGTVRPFRLAFLDEKSVAFSAGSNPSLLIQAMARRGGGAGSAVAELQQRGMMAGAHALQAFAQAERLIDANPEGIRIGPFQFGKQWLQGSKTVRATVESGPLDLAIHVEDHCDGAESATRIAGAFRGLLAILNATQPSQGSSQRNTPDNTTQALLAAVSIQQNRDSVLVDWRPNASMLLALLGVSK